MNFEFLIPRRPVSLQTRKRENLQAWKAFVRGQAARSWQGVPYDGGDLQLTLVYLCGEDPVDVDNIIKPIQDALVGLVYDDDVLVADVGSHRRPLTGLFDVARCPAELIRGLLSGEECVWVGVGDSRPMEDYLG